MGRWGCGVLGILLLAFPGGRGMGCCEEWGTGRAHHRKGAAARLKSLFPPISVSWGAQSTRAPAVGRGLARCCPQTRAEQTRGRTVLRVPTRTQGSILALAPASSLPKPQRVSGQLPSSGTALFRSAQDSDVGKSVVS